MTKNLNRTLNLKETIRNMHFKNFHLVTANCFMLNLVLKNRKWDCRVFTV